jgi:hypothetical protein
MSKITKPTATETIPAADRQFCGVFPWCVLNISDGHEVHEGATLASFEVTHGEADTPQVGRVYTRGWLDARTGDSEPRRVILEVPSDSFGLTYITPEQAVAMAAALVHAASWSSLTETR